MGKPKILTAMLISLMLASSFAALTVFVRTDEPTKAIKKPTVTVSDASTSAFSGYNITAETSDEGRVTFLFVWQRSAKWNFTGFYGEVVFDTPPILQMSRYEKNGSLEYSISYIPLFLIQYNDTDGNGLFDLQTEKGESVTSEVEDNLIAWWEQLDKPCKAYSLAPIFYFNRPNAWSWDVSPLTCENITVGDTIVPTYSWNISASVPSIPWLCEYLLKCGWHLPEVTNVNVFFGYQVKLLPENPEVKYDFKFSGINWTKDEDSMKLSMMSAILYHSRKPPVVRVGVERYFGFCRTIPVSVAVKMFTISENVTDRVEAFVSYSPNATVDGVEVADVVKEAIHPLFLIPITTVTIVPEGVYIRGICPGMIMGRCLWNHYLAFSHQLSLPHFNESVEQDPVISIAAALPTVSLFPPSTEGNELPIRAIAALALVSTVVAYIIIKRR